MTQPIAREEALTRWLRRGWRLQLLRLGVLLFYLVFAVGWAFGAGLAVIVLWRHGSSKPAVAVFLGAWLLLWAAIPIWLVRVFLRQPAEHGSAERMCRVFGRGDASIFYGCFTVAWFAGLAGVLQQGDVGGFLLMSAFTAVFFPLFIAQFLHIVQRQTVSTDLQALEIRNTYGPLRRTRRYELRLILNPRAEREQYSEGFTGLWEVAFEYGSKTVRFGDGLSWQEAEDRVRELAQLI